MFGAANGKGEVKVGATIPLKATIGRLDRRGPFRGLGFFVPAR